jgi:hypothetical protein
VASLGSAVASLATPLLEKAPGGSSIAAAAPAAQAMLQGAFHYLAAHLPGVGGSSSSSSSSDSGSGSDSVYAGAPEADPLHSADSQHLQDIEAELGLNGVVAGGSTPHAQQQQQQQGTAAPLPKGL